MPQDTVWLNNRESFLVFDSNTLIDESTIQKLMSESPGNSYANQVAYYDNFGNYFLVFILICLGLFIRYAYREAKKEKRKSF